MADASKVFRYLRDYHEIDSIAYLTEEQKNVVRRFFSNFTDDDSALQKRFLQLWSKLYEVYQTYNDSLKAQGVDITADFTESLIMQYVFSAIGCASMMFTAFRSQK